MSVTFDGINKLIICGLGTINLNVKEDIYSDWKLWVTQEDNARFLPALSVLGGDPIGSGIYLGTTYFLENGWKIRPNESNHTLNISGNIYSRDGSNPIVKTLGEYNVLVNMARSNLIDTVATGGSSGSAPSAEEVAQAVWNALLDSFNTYGTMGATLKNAELKIDDVLALEMIE